MWAQYSRGPFQNTEALQLLAALAPHLDECGVSLTDVYPGLTGHYFTWTDFVRSQDQIQGQYEFNDDGVCIVLRRAILDKAVRAVLGPNHGVWDGPVQYNILAETPTPDKNAFSLNGNKVDSDGAIEVLKEHVKRFYKVLLFTKALDWRDEKEYRWACMAPDLPECVFVPIQDSLVAVIAGCDFPIGASHAKLFTLCKNANKQLLKLQWHQGAMLEPSVLPSSD